MSIQLGRAASVSLRSTSANENVAQGCRRHHRNGHTPRWATHHQKEKTRVRLCHSHSLYHSRPSRFQTNAGMGCRRAMIGICFSGFLRAPKSVTGVRGVISTVTRLGFHGEEILFSPFPPLLWRQRCDNKWHSATKAEDRCYMCVLRATIFCEVFFHREPWDLPCKKRNLYTFINIKMLLITKQFNFSNGKSFIMFVIRIKLLLKLFCLC